MSNTIINTHYMDTTPKPYRLLTSVQKVLHEHTHNLRAWHKAANTTQDSLNQQPRSKRHG